MIRLQLVLLLVLAQTIFAERLVLQMATGGRGAVMIVNLIDPWITLALVIIPFWRDVARIARTKQFVFYWLPFLLLMFTLPLLGVALVGFPVRSAFAAWGAVTPACFVAIGAIGSLYAGEHRKLISRCFLFAVLAQFGLAAVQMMAQFGILPGVLKAIYDWDFQFKVLHQADNIIVERATGLYLNPNALGIWALLALWTSFFMLSGKAKVVGSTASFLTILLCQSRGTLAAFLGSAAIYSGVWMLLRGSPQRRRKATLLAVICIVPVMVILIPGLLDSLFGRLEGIPVVGHALERYTSGSRVLVEGASADTNFEGRTFAWKVAYDYLNNHPFGSLGPPQMVILVPPDNQFVGALEQGSLYFLGALLLAFHGAVRLINSPWPHSRALAVGGIGMAINGITAVPFAYPASLLFWLLVGMHLAHLVQPEPESLEAEEAA